MPSESDKYEAPRRRYWFHAHPVALAGDFPADLTTEEIRDWGDFAPTRVEWKEWLRLRNLVDRLMARQAGTPEDLTDEIAKAQTARDEVFAALRKIAAKWFDDLVARRTAAKKENETP